MKRSPRPAFVSTFAVLAFGCSSSASAPTATQHDDAGQSETAIGADSGTDTSPSSDDAPIAAVDSGTDAETANADSGATNPPECPTDTPIIGDKCAGAIVCTYSDACPARPKGQDTFAMECHLGKWALSGEQYTAPCPIDIPEEDGSCLCGAHMPKACGYDICDVDGEPPLLAICDEKSATWLILVQECNPPPPGTDAGTDTHDAGASD